MLATAASGVAGPGSPLEIWQHIVADFSNLGDPKALAAFGSVLMIDLVLAGDNAIVVGALAAGLPADQRKKVILIGIGLLVCELFHFQFSDSLHLHSEELALLNLQL